MVFDVRGRRRHVVRFVYAVLALLMGASLFLVVGPFSVGNLIGGSGGSTSAAKIDQEQVQKIEERLRRDPKSEALLLSLTRAHIIAAAALSETNPETGLATPTAEAVREYAAASASWGEYLEQARTPSPAAAQQMAQTYIKLAEISGSIEESNANIAKAAKTQRIAAEAQPTLGSLSSLATYEYFTGNYAEGDKLAAEAAKKTTKTEAKEVQKKLAATRVRAKQYEKEVREFAKTEREKGKEALKNPSGGLGGSLSLGG